jgi:hypothetical protein
MKWKLATAALFACASAISISAQAQVWAVRVKVPFAFEVSDKRVPAGEYVLFSQRNQIYLREADGNYVAIAQSNHVSRDAGNTGQVVFRCYEKQCFLSQLWLPDAEQGRVLLESKSEKEAARKASPQTFALIGEPAQTGNRGQK